MYESPHRIADTLRGLLAASSPPPPQAVGSGTDGAEGRARDEEGKEGGSIGSSVSVGAAGGGESAASTGAEFAAGQR